MVTGQEGLVGLERQEGAPAAMPSRGRANPRRGISEDSRWGWGPSAATIIVHATAPATLRENERIPKRPLMAAPMPGNSGMSQM